MFHPNNQVLTVCSTTNYFYALQSSELFRCKALANMVSIILIPLIVLYTRVIEGIYKYYE
jgi:hypothetical protein